MRGGAAYLMPSAAARLPYLLPPMRAAQILETLGTSFNADHPALVPTLQAVFDRDRASSYAWRLT
jgi:hypothetical protein